MATCPYRYPFAWPSPIDQPAEFAGLHDERTVDVVLPSGDKALLLTRYADIQRVLLTPTVSKNRNRPGVARMTETKAKAFQSQVDMDPPAHPRMRRLIAKAFTSARVEAIRPRVLAMTDELLDEMAEASGSVDINQALAFPLSIRVICEMLGVPADERANFVGAKKPPFDYMRSLIERKRADPRDDLISELIKVHDEQDGRLAEPELLWWSTVLLLAGYETTANQISSAVVLLLAHPDQLAWLRADLDRIPKAVEELLRCQVVGTSLSMLRITTEDIDIDGLFIPAGTSVIPSLEVANHDPEVFGDGRFDLAAERQQQITFSVGRHFCVGAPLARAQLQIALRRLLERFPTLELAVPVESLRRGEDAYTQGFTEVPVTW